MRASCLPAVLLCGAVLLLGAVPGSAQVVLHVDQANCPGPGSGTAADPFCLIQPAIVAAADGDEVRVAPGTYGEALDLLGKRILLRSSAGPEVTTLTSENSSIVVCRSGETLETVIEGFTFTGGRGTFRTDCTGGADPPLSGFFGGAILVLDSSLTIRDCTFRDNMPDPGDAVVGGGAIYVRGGSAQVSGSHFTGNTTGGTGVVYGSTAAICGGVGRLTVTDSTFDANGTRGFGGGIYTYRSSATVERCKFTDNVSNWGAGVCGFPSAGPEGSVDVRDCEFHGGRGSHGGGVFVWATNGAGASVEDSFFTGAVISGGGGGAGVWAYTGTTTATVRRNTFIGNRAGTGGGLEVSVGEGGTIQVDNNLLVDNHVTGVGNLVVGGGIAILRNGTGRVDVANCTVMDNTSSVNGGGIFATGSGSVPHTVTNTIVRGNVPNQLGGLIDGSFCNVEDGYFGPGNFDSDPRFVNPAARDYHLLPDSSCIDEGSTATIPELLSDLDGQPRVVEELTGSIFGTEPRVDVGTYEFPHGSLVRFEADAATLAWPAVGTAQFYNVYRGELSALADLDGNGVPDLGYGQCANDLDPDTTDTEFTDTDVPEPSSGFFYLMSVVGLDGVERFLGTTSAGLPRQPLDPCLP